MYHTLSCGLKLLHIATVTISLFFGTAKTNLYAVAAYITNTCTRPSSSSFVSLSNLFYPHLCLWIWDLKRDCRSCSRLHSLTFCVKYSYHFWMRFSPTVSGLECCQSGNFALSFYEYAAAAAHNCRLAMVLNIQLRILLTFAESEIPRLENLRNNISWDMIRGSLTNIAKISNIFKQSILLLFKYIIDTMFKT